MGAESAFGVMFVTIIGSALQLEASAQMGYDFGVASVSKKKHRRIAGWVKFLKQAYALGMTMLGEPGPPRTSPPRTSVTLSIDVVWRKCLAF
jgi:hypothetical protein